MIPTLAAALVAGFVWLPQPPPPPPRPVERVCVDMGLAYDICYTVQR